MSHGNHSNENQSSCLICLNSDQPISRTTRNSKKDYWICCDVCQNWFHACCGGYTVSQYNKITKSNIWIKCVVCCLQQVRGTVYEDSNSHLHKLIEQAVSDRCTESTLNKCGKKTKGNLKQRTVNIQSVVEDSEANLDSDKRDQLQKEDLDESVCNIEVAKNDGVDGNSQEENNRIIDSCCEADIDKVLIIDNIQNSGQFSSSKQILKELHNYFPEVKVELAYSLAKGGVALHTSCKSDRDFLVNELPRVLWGGVKHLPKGKGARFCSVYVKGVDTSVDVQWFSALLTDKGVAVSEIRRLTKRYSGRPTQVVRVKCDHQSADRLLNFELTINDKHCTVERERGFTVIRCFHCQSLGHVAKNCSNDRRCEFCAQNHTEIQACGRNAKPMCVNCMGSHPSTSSYCPVFRNRHATLAKQYSECNSITTVTPACSTEASYRCHPVARNLASNRK